MVYWNKFRLRRFFFSRGDIDENYPDDNCENYIVMISVFYIKFQIVLKVF